MAHRIKEDFLYCAVFKTILDLSNAGEFCKMKRLRSRLICDGVDPKLIYNLTYQCRRIVREGRYDEINHQLTSNITLAIITARYKHDSEKKLDEFDYIKLARRGS